MRANRYVSYLAAEIEPKAMANLARFETATESTFDRIERFSTRSGMAAGFVTPKAIRDTASAQAALRGMQAQADRTGTSVRRLTHESSAMGVAFTRAGQALQTVQGPLGPLAGRLSALGNAFRTLSGFALAGVLGGGSAFALGSIATQYQTVTDRLRPFFDTQTALNGAMNDVVGIAKRTKQALDPVAELYIRITQAARDAGIEQKRTSRMVETVAKAVRLSGGSRAGQAAALTQFAQGFGTNLSGDELRSIREQAPRLAQAIADGLGVTTSKLKELGSAGVLTAELITQALERSAKDIDVEFSRLPPRIGSSLTQAGNNVSLFIGRIDEATGATTGLAKAIDFLGGNLNNIAAAGFTFVAAMNMRSIIDQFRTVEKVVDGVRVRQVGVVAQLGNWISRTADMVRYQNQLNRTTQIGNVNLRDTAGLVMRVREANLGRAKSEQAVATAAATGARETQAALRQNLNLIAQQRAAAVRQRNTAETLVAANPKSAAAARALAEANREVAASTAARIRTQQLLVAVDTELTAAEARLAASSKAVAIAQVAMVGPMNIGAAAATRTSIVMNLLAGAQLRVAAVGSSLVAFLGGPWGVAFLAAAGAVAYLVTRTDQAREAVANFKGGQEALAERLGITTGKLIEQAGAARDLAIALGQAGLAKARQQRRDVGDQLAGQLETAARNVRDAPGAGWFRLYRDTPAERAAKAQRERDAATLRRAAKLAREGKLDPAAYSAIANIQNRRGDAFEGGMLDSLLGSNPEKVAETFEGYAASVFNVRDAEAALAETREAADQKGGPPVIPNPRSASQLAAAAQQRAAETELQRAKADLAALKAKGRGKDESEDEYITRYSDAIQRVRAATEAEQGATRARSAGAAAARKHAAEMRKEAAAAETARDKLTQLQNLRDEFSDAPTGVQRANKAVRRIQDFVGERVGNGVYTQADFEADAARINAAVRKPIQDAIKDGDRQIAIQRLVLEGRSQEAELLERALGLVDQVGDISEAELQRLRAQLDMMHAINDAEAKRGALIDIYAKGWADVRSASREFLRDFVRNPVKSFGDLAKRLRDAFADAWADKLTLEIFGDPEKAFRDEMTRGLDNSAGRLITAADVLRIAGRQLQQAAAAQGGGTGVGTLPGGTEIPAGEFGPVVGAAGAALHDVVNGDIIPALANMTQAIEGVDRAVTAASGVPGTGEEEIVVTGTRIKPRPDDPLPTSVTDNFNKIGKEFATRIFGANSPITKVFSRLGLALEGGMVAGTLNSAAGNPLPPGIAQGLGAIVGTAFPQAMAGITAAMPQIAAALAVNQALGSLLGNDQVKHGKLLNLLIGPFATKLFGSALRGSATITSIDGDVSTRGNSKSRIAAAEGMAGGVQDMIRRVADVLGGSTGSFAVSIGQRKKKFTVDPSGQGRTKGSGVLKFDSEEDAIKAALLDALRDGAIAGIREGAQRLLQAGKDLDVALDKALKFQNVFRRLKGYLDPVGAALDDLNTEFEGLKKIFTEAGASAQEWQDLQRLYEFERAKTIEQAAEEALGELRDFINGELRGSDSPLSRRAVYDNAKAALDNATADFDAGKITGNQLVPFLEDFKAASRELNGSRSAFFQDWDALMALAQRAAATLPPVPGSGAAGTTLPGSPFDATLLANTGTIAGLTAEQNSILTDGFRALLERLGGGGGAGSSLALLPSNLAAVGGGGGGSFNNVQPH